MRAKPGSLFITRSMEAFWMLATLASVTASANTSCQRPSTRLSLPKTPPVLEEGRRGLLVVAVDLVQPHRAGEQEVELVVGIAWREDRVLRLETPLDGPEAGPLEIVEVEPFRRACGGETPGAVARKHLIATSLMKRSVNPAKAPGRAYYTRAFLFLIDRSGAVSDVALRPHVLRHLSSTPTRLATKRRSSRRAPMSLS